MSRGGLADLLPQPAINLLSRADQRPQHRACLVQRQKQCPSRPVLAIRTGGDAVDSQDTVMKDNGTDTIDEDDTH